VSIVNAAVLGVLVGCLLILLLYAVRHYLMVLRRLTASPPLDPMELTGFVLPSVTVIVPMHNEEQVAGDVLKAIVESDYDRSLLEVIVVNDRSTDHTGRILDRFAAEYPLVKVLHRTTGDGGKAAALEYASAHAWGDILVMFDADYIPGRALLKRLVVPFCDPEVGAVMGRVVPHNANSTLLSALLELERAAGYQIGQQARQRLHFTPQFGGTVGGVRMTALGEIGGWNTRSLTEDTDLTFRLVLGGWKVAYVNRAECYEEVPESWGVRRRQIARWATGHTECFHRFAWRIVRSPALRVSERIDALFVLGCYLTAPVLVIGWLCSLWLVLFAPEFASLTFVVALMLIGCQLFGSQATFVEMGAAAYLDRNRHRVLLLPLALMSFFSSTVAICDALWRFYARKLLTGRGGGRWHKTLRFRTNGNGSLDAASSHNGSRNGSLHPAPDAARGGNGGLRLTRNTNGTYRASIKPLASPP
jgi:cellulose synthase/poly-beta-1,6-N-acetylglucosamine synthase-like glycosyltransferase